MELPIRARDSVKTVAIDFADAFPASLVPEWSAALDTRSTEPQRDAVEFLESAVSKWTLYERKRRIVHSLEALRARIDGNENGEFLGILTASAPWYRNGAVVGFCQFRRTWCNNVVFDFLGVHPVMLVPAQRDISGLGTALLYGLAQIANALEADLIWAETTDTSANFYKKVFALPSLADLLVIKAQKFFQPLNSAIEAQLKVM